MLKILLQTLTYSPEQAKEFMSYPENRTLRIISNSTWETMSPEKKLKILKKLENF